MASDFEESWKVPVASDIDYVKGLLMKATTNDNNDVQEIMRYAIEPFGKLLRPTLCILSYYTCGGDNPERVRRFAAAAELLHTSTLIHDDINDKSAYRRGQPSLFKRYGARKSLVVGDMLMMSAFDLVKDDMERYIDFMKGIAFGLANSEFNQMKNEFNVDITEDDYLGIISGKTAMFFSQCTRIGSLDAGSGPDIVQAFEKYGLLYGIGFQIADDILDVKGTVDVTGKSVGIDIMEGKMTLPVIMAMRDPTYGRTIRKMISDRCDHEEILDVVRDTQSIDICERMASSYSQRAIESLEPIPESEYKDALVHLAQGVAKRSF